MNSFSIADCTTVDAALSQLKDDAVVKAGGVDLLDRMKDGIEQPTRLVNIRNVAELRGIRETDQGMTLGPLTTLAEIGDHAHIREHYQILADACGHAATPHIRNMATVGGNLLQRTRCGYFYDDAARCNKRVPGSGCDAFEGFNRIHAILGASSSCVATHPSDMAVALRVLDAQVETALPTGERRVIPIAELHRLPGQTPQHETNLRPAELITAVTLQPPPPGRQLYRKVRDRASYAFALVSVAAIVDGAAGRLRSARMAFGGLAHKPWRDEAVEQHIAGRSATQDTFRLAADGVLRGARGHGHNDFKIVLAQRVLEAVLAEGVGGASRG